MYKYLCIEAHSVDTLFKNMYLRGVVGLGCEEATARESRHSRNLRFNEISIYYLHEQVNFTRF